MRIFYWSWYVVLLPLCACTQSLSTTKSSTLLRNNEELKQENIYLWSYSSGHTENEWRVSICLPKPDDDIRVVFTIAVKDEAESIFSANLPSITRKPDRFDRLNFQIRSEFIGYSFVGINWVFVNELLNSEKLDRSILIDLSSVIYEGGRVNEPPSLFECSELQKLLM